MYSLFYHHLLLYIEVIDAWTIFQIISFLVLPCNSTCSWGSKNDKLLIFVWLKPVCSLKNVHNEKIDYATSLVLLIQNYKFLKKKKKLPKERDLINGGIYIKKQVF